MNQDVELQIILTGTLKQIYNILMAHKEESTILEETWIKVKYGITHTFDIQYHFHTHVRVFPKRDEIIIQHKRLALKDYWNEIEQREALIRSTLIQELYANKDIHAPRGGMT